MDSTPPKIIDSVNDKAYSSLSKAEGTLIILDDMLINIKPIQKPLDRTDKKRNLLL